MGGFGALALGMKHTAIFGSVVAYAPALLDAKPLDGVLTLTRPVPDSGVENTELNLLSFQQMFGSSPRLFDQYSPWSLVPRNAPALREVLPVRVIVGTEDRLFKTIDLFHDVMTENLYAHEYFVIKDVAHDLGGLYAVVGLNGLQYHARAGEWQ